MYCPSCGTESTQGLNYCKRCGANLSMTLGPDNPPSRPRNLTGMVWAVAVLVAGSFSALFGGVIAMAALGIHQAEVLGPTILMGTLGIVVVAALLIRFLSKLAALPESTESRSEKRRAKQNLAQRQISASPDYIPSVTEHTTRVFDPSERKEPDTRG